MIIRIGSRTDPGAVDLVEANRFDRFHVEARAGASRADIDTALRRSGAGSFGADGGDPLISVDWIRRRRGDDAGADWGGAFSGMLAYAAKKNWYSPAADTIQAHVEYR